MGNGTKVAMLAVLVLVIGFILYYATQDTADTTATDSAANAPVEPEADERGPNPSDPALNGGRATDGNNTGARSGGAANPNRDSSGDRDPSSERRRYSLMPNEDLNLDFGSSDNRQADRERDAADRSDRNRGGGGGIAETRPDPDDIALDEGGGAGMDGSGPTDATGDADSAGADASDSRSRTDDLENRLAALNALDEEDGSGVSDGDGTNDSDAAASSRTGDDGRASPADTGSDATDPGSGSDGRAGNRPRIGAVETGGSDPSAGEDEFIEHEVRSGDNFWVLAEQYLGAGEHKELIRRANPMVDPNRLQIGQTIYIPRRVPTSDDGAGNVTDGNGGGAGRPDPDLPADAATVRVEQDDSLWRIAVREYGDGTKWRRIYEANRDRMESPDDLDIGQVLILPPASEEDEDK